MYDRASVERMVGKGGDPYSGAAHCSAPVTPQSMIDSSMTMPPGCNGHTMLQQKENGDARLHGSLGILCEAVRKHYAYTIVCRSSFLGENWLTLNSERVFSSY